MKKALAFLLTVSMLVSVCAFSTVANAVDDELYAAVVSFDNRDVSKIRTTASYSAGDLDNSGKINSSDVSLTRCAVVGTVSLTDTMRLAADLNNDGKISATDVLIMKSIMVGVMDVPMIGAQGGNAAFNNSAFNTVISGTGKYSIRIDVSDVNFQNHEINSVVLDVGVNLSYLTVIPVYGNSETGFISDAAELVRYNGSGYFRFANASNISGIIILSNQVGLSYTITQAYFCANDYSAKFVVDNDILPSTATSKRLVITEKGNNVAIKLGQMTQDDRTNTNGGLYHDYTNTKWPTIAVDENDKIYIAGSGCRMVHVDPFGSTVMVTSTDGGATFSKPRQISNTIKDDRDPGLTYLGNGKFLASYFSVAGSSYLPGGENYGVLKNEFAGGSSSSWQADSWDSAGNPIGGINGTYVSLLQYIIQTDPDYDMGNHSYVIKSTDYGETWDAAPYTLKGSHYTTAMQNMNRNYQITEPGTEVPVTTPHGPIVLSDGTVCWVGKILTPTDLPLKEIGAYVSNDEGATWQYRGRVSIPCTYTNQDFQEPDITETKDGVLVCTLRSFDIFTCFSYDKGATWTTPQQAHLDGISHHIMTMPNGDLVLTSAYRYSPKKIYAYVSEDGGRTWSQKAEFSRNFKSDDDMGYPSSVCLSDGTIVTAYYGTAASGDWNSSIMTTSWTYKLR